MNTKRMLLIAGAAGLFAGSLSAQVATVEGRLSGIDSDTLLVDYFPENGCSSHTTGALYV